ncbi:hypothetical protein ACMFMG_000205 [Clarireedia jacksonii]
MGDPAPVPAQFFDAIGIKYEEAFSHNPGLIDFVKLALKIIPEKASVLDIGCGTGTPVSSMVAESGRKIYGIDNSSTMISLSQKAAPDGTFEVINFFDYEPKSLLMLSSLSFVFTTRAISTWIVPNGYLFLATMVADDFEKERLLEPDGDYGGRRASTIFMGASALALVFPMEGWKSILKDAGFNFLQENQYDFQPPATYGSNLEHQHFIVARNITNK